MERWISVKEYARRIGKTTSAVYYMIANNKVEARHFAYGNKKGHLMEGKDGEDKRECEDDSIPSDTTKRKMPIVVDPKLHPHPRYHDTNVGDIRFRIKTTKKDTVKADTIKVEVKK